MLPTPRVKGRFPPMTIPEKAHPGTAALALGLFGWALFLVSGLLAETTGQQIETDNGVRVVHNKKGGLWANAPKVALELVRTIGDVDTDDENLAFDSPLDMAVGEGGAIYVLDTGNQRIQVFGSDGRYLRTIGRRGQGPGEFQSPSSITLDHQGNIYVLDDAQMRIQVVTPEGKVAKTLPVTTLGLDRVRLLGSGGLVARGYGALGPQGVSKEKTPPKLIRLLGPDLEVIGEFGEPVDYGEEITNRIANSLSFEADREDNVCLGFIYQNRIEKYSPGGKLLWRADRPLDYSTKPIEKGRQEVTTNTVRFFGPKLNRVADGLAVDGRGRIWVVTRGRQIRKEEEVTIMMSGSVNGGSTRKVVGAADLRKTDMYKLEIFDPDGVLLGAIPLTHFVDGIWIHGDRLFLLDRDRGVQFYEYKINEK
jgi:sugar lactone lactonase YvrE